MIRAKYLKHYAKFLPQIFLCTYSPDLNDLRDRAYELHNRRGQKMNFTFSLLLCLLKQWLETIEEEQIELQYEQSNYHHLGYSTLDLQHF